LYIEGIFLPFVIYAFPTPYAFSCVTADHTAAAEGYKQRDGWHVFAESRAPVDMGKASKCTEDQTGNTLTCDVAWFNTTTTTTLVLNNGQNTASGTLGTIDGANHSFSGCIVE